jgi:hypothetical protein
LIGFIGTTEVVPFHKAFRSGFFRKLLGRAENGRKINWALAPEVSKSKPLILAPRNPFHLCGMLFLTRNEHAQPETRLK